MRTPTFVLGLAAMAIVAILSYGAGFAQGPQGGGAISDATSPGYNPNPPILSTTLLTYQGRLTSSSGSAISSMVTMTFRIYNSSGTLLWTSAARSVTPANGLFTVILGESPDSPVTPSTLAAAASIGVTVDGDAEMTPRQPINSLVGHSTTGFGVIGTSSTGMGVYGASDTATGSYGLSSSGAGAVGNSTSGIGVYAHSSSGPGLMVNNGGSGNLNAAIVANNTLTTTGVAGYFSNSSGNATAQFGNTGSGKAGAFNNNGVNPTASFNNLGSGSVLSLYSGGGPFINGFDPLMDTVFQVKANGDVTQDVSADGLVKAAAAVNCAGLNSSLIRSFNHVGGTVTVLNGNMNTGYCVIDFGFQIEDRYFSATAAGTGVDGAACFPTGSQLACRRYNNGSVMDGGIEILIY